MKTPILLAFSGWVLGLASCTPLPQSSAPEVRLPAATLAHFDSTWATRAYWDDGLAEVATYEAERVIYNKPRSFDFTLITVKEDFNREFDVKTDRYDRPDLLPMMKVNAFCRIPTDNYPYHFLTSLFFRRAQPTQLHKLTSSSQEWCGTTFKAFTSQATGYRFSFNSYWDGQGTGQQELVGAMLVEDGLPYSLRALRFAARPAFRVPVGETQQTSKATPPTIYQAAVSVHDTTLNGRQSWAVQVQLAPGKRNRYYFAQDYPNLLLAQTTWDGRSLRLKEVHRAAYWQH